ncbi:MAG: di-trans,poly-cis-decaprenylcistransferase [Nitrospiraceae bacterium]|nr:MAG: di-trans,poly-cis-decaprenylcistransferase [Nitrospiraceae bacterium]
MDLKGSTPVHIGIIMDGNGRWAAQQDLPRIEGHRRGAERAKEIAEIADEFGIQYLTLYAFSNENWKRPQNEINTLMKILEYYLKNEIMSLLDKGIKFKAIGDISRLPDNIRALIEDTEKRTVSNKGMTLIAALSYSGSDEVVRAIRKVIDREIKTDDVTEELFSSFLDTAGIPSPDLIIRTSGEKRLSNFLLWQCAYSELYFTETLWPDFNKDEFIKAVKDFQGRERHFGNLNMRSNAF